MGAGAAGGLAGWLAAVILAALANSALSAAEAGFNLTEVATGVYVHQGRHVPFEDKDHDDIANIGFIVGERCVAVIDSGGSLRIGQALRAAVRNTTRLPVCYLINTHVHPDHVLGNIAFARDKPEIVGHQLLPETLASNRDYFLETFAQDLGENPNPEAIVPPSKTVSKTLDLDLGGRVLKLTAYSAAHTGADLTVFDAKTSTLWLSDLLSMERIPALDGSLKGWLEVLEQLRSVEAKRVVPGHGPASAEWPAALAAEERYLKTLLDEIRTKIAEGGSLAQALESVGTSEKGQWQLFEQHHKRNVSKAFAEVEWE
jgi:quinoprotein relay system zinc metallohydrolase 2